MSKECHFTECCICLYGNECAPHWNLPNEFTNAPRELIIQRLLDLQFSEYRDKMILTLKNFYNFEFDENMNYRKNK